MVSVGTPCTPHQHAILMLYAEKCRARHACTLTEADRKLFHISVGKYKLFPVCIGIIPHKLLNNNVRLSNQFFRTYKESNLQIT